LIVNYYIKLLNYYRTIITLIVLKRTIYFYISKIKKFFFDLL